MSAKRAYTPFLMGWLIIATVFVAAVATAMPTMAQTPQQATATVSLNVRSGPATTYAVIFVLPQGAAVAVYECSTAQTWCRLGYGGRNGWASARYLNFNVVAGVSEPPPASGPKEPVGGQTQATATVRLNIRTGPSTAYPVIGAIPAGGVVDVLRCTEGYIWCELIYGRTQGWASARYLRSTAPQYVEQPLPNVGNQIGLQLFEFILGQIVPTPPPAAPRPGQACFFADWNYEGASFCVAVNNDVGFVGAEWNDRISSIRLDPGVTILVCADAEYAGWCDDMTGNVAALMGDRNDAISSIRVR